MSALPGAAALLFNTHTYARGRTAEGAYHSQQRQQPQTYMMITPHANMHTHHPHRQHSYAARALRQGGRVWSVLPDALDMNRDAHDGALEERACCGALQAWCCCAASCAALVRWLPLQPEETRARQTPMQSDGRRRFPPVPPDVPMNRAERNLTAEAKNHGRSAYDVVAGAPYN